MLHLTMKYPSNNDMHSLNQPLLGNLFSYESIKFSVISSNIFPDCPITQWDIMRNLYN